MCVAFLDLCECREEEEEEEKHFRVRRRCNRQHGGKFHQKLLVTGPAMVWFVPGSENSPFQACSLPHTCQWNLLG